MVYLRIYFPVLYSKTSLLIHSICNSLYLLIPNAHVIPGYDLLYVCTQNDPLETFLLEEIPTNL